MSNITSRDAQADHDRLEALWTCQNLNAVEPQLLERVLKSDEPRARAAAVRVAGDWANQVPDAIRLIAPMVDDSFPRVRLEAVRALAMIPSLESVRAATGVLDKPMDPVLDYALWLTCNDLASRLAAGLRAGKARRLARGPSQLRASRREVAGGGEGADHPAPRRPHER